MNRHYIVTVTVRCGEYEKTVYRLVAALTSRLARNYACFCEAHSPETLDWTADNWVNDMHGEFGYRAVAKEVEEPDVDVLAKYLPHHSADIEEMVAEGNYQEYVDRDHVD